MITSNPLTATIALHKELLHHVGMEGYEGDKEAFDRLYTEIEYIGVCNPLLTDDEVIEEFYSNQMQVANGELVCDYYMY
jgi:hypothetical protein